MKLHEALNIDLNEINREIKNLVTHDKDVPKKSQLAQSILELTGSGETPPSADGHCRQPVWSET